MTIDPHPTIGPRLGGEDCGGPFGRGRSDDGGMALVSRSTVRTLPAPSTPPLPRRRGLLQCSVGEGAGLEGEAAPWTVTPHGDGTRLPAAWPRPGRRSPGAATSRPSAASCPAAAGAGRQPRGPARPPRGRRAPPPPWYGRRPLRGRRGLPCSSGPRPPSSVASRTAASSCASSGPSPPSRCARWGTPPSPPGQPRPPLSLASSTRLCSVTASGGASGVASMLSYADGAGYFRGFLKMALKCGADSAR